MITRISKIARLPQQIREELNQRLFNGEMGRTILPWLNELPETKQVLAEFFAAKPVTQQNLSEWRHSGYQDWLLHQQRLEWFSRLTEQEKEIAQHDRCSDTFETMGNIFIYEIGQALTTLQKIKNPHDHWARLQNLTREFARLQNAYNWSRRVQLEWDRTNLKFAPKQVREPEPPQLETSNPQPATSGIPQPETQNPKLETEISRPTDVIELEIVKPSHEEPPRQPETRLQPETPNSKLITNPTPSTPDPQPSAAQPAFQPIPTHSPTTPIPLPPQIAKSHIASYTVRRSRSRFIEG